MIKVDRDAAPAPESLNKPYGERVKHPKIKGKTELESVKARIKEYRKKVGTAKNELAKFKFPYERYSDSEVIKALKGLFHGKCAYCESRYARTQPMDVEHWRPKGQVKENVGGKPEIGYYWLASEWTNLLPSCIDCNRARTQFDAFSKKQVLLGKKNQFPVEGARISDHNDDEKSNGGNEEVLLINPCIDDPETLLEYDDQGLILPKATLATNLEHKRAMESIRVYALNRAELVADRLAVVRMIDHRLLIIERLGELRIRLSENDMNREKEVVADIIASEIDVLLEMTKPEQEFAGLARQLLRDVRPSSS